MIAERFVQARKTKTALADYPGEAPTDLADAYTTQDVAISLWPTPLMGWKVGGVAPPWSETLGIKRIVGPVFEDKVHHAVAEDMDLPVYDGGFSAFEGEVLAVLGADVPEGKPVSPLRTHFPWSDRCGLLLRSRGARFRASMITGRW